MVGLVVDEVVSAADMELVAVRVALVADEEVLEVDMEVVVVEVSAAVDMAGLPLVLMMLAVHRYHQTPSLTSQLLARREVKRSTFATSVSQLSMPI
mgnify:CR=1 FL=1